jgi:hypothetical protein
LAQSWWSLTGSRWPLPTLWFLKLCSLPSHLTGVLNLLQQCFSGTDFLFPGVELEQEDRACKARTIFTFTVI